MNWWLELIGGGKWPPVFDRPVALALAFMFVCIGLASLMGGCSMLKISLFGAP